MPPPKQKPVTPSRPVLSGRFFTHTAAAYRSSRHLRAIDLAEQLATLLVVARIAADRRETVRRERHEVLEREAPRDVLDVRVEAAVLVDRRGSRAAGWYRRSPGRTR